MSWARVCCAAHIYRSHFVLYAGGPAGGNGGSGGNVWVQADDSLNSLTTFRKQVHYRADNGRPGGGSNMTGANAEDLIIKVSHAVLLCCCQTVQQCIEQENRLCCQSVSKAPAAALTDC